jgi:hypothetical protein
VDTDQIVARLEGKLDRLQSDLVPRAEHERRDARLDTRFDRLEAKLDRTLGLWGEQERRLDVAESRLADVTALEKRMGPVEEAAIVHRRREGRRGWLVPTVASAIGVFVNALLTGISVFAAGGTGGN